MPIGRHSAVQKNMNFSANYAILFGLAGFAAAAYFLKTGSRAKHVPWIFLALCALYSLANYGAGYAMLTIIEFAIGFGVAHAVIKVERSPNKSDDSNRKTLD
jgi:uncharacterized membrane protein